MSDATVQEGKEFSFECRLIGQPIPEIIWYKDGISILNNPDYLTTYANGVCTLKIEETFAEDSAKYTCRAFNINGSVETSATLTVKGNLIYMREFYQQQHALYYSTVYVYVYMYVYVKNFVCRNYHGRTAKWSRFRERIAVLCCKGRVLP